MKKPNAGFRFLPVLFFPLLSGVSVFAPVFAAESRPAFVLPAACTPGRTCWTVNYVDVDPAPGAARDFSCGPRTYEQHQGTDIALPDRAAMETGVAVLAAADGAVLRVRDGIADAEPSSADIEKMLKENRACGNGVVVDHGGGWQTIYCHMKKDSLAVKPGDKVRAGDRLGLIGQSGAAEMPHVHFGVFFEKKVIDPFTGAGEADGCGRGTDGGLWAASAGLAYEPVALYGGGFAEAVPDFEAVKVDARPAKTLSASAPVLAFWAGIYGAAAGDRIHIEIRDPGGRVFAERDIVQEKDRARQFYYVGRKRAGDLFPAGAWTGRMTLVREGKDGAPAIERLYENAAEVTPGGPP